MMNMSTPSLTFDEQVTVPSELDAASSKLVYLYLATKEGASITELSTSLGMRKLSLYSVLGSLAERDLVERSGETYRVVG
jgi:DNA-binding IclR family transcriptional regulator